MNSEIHAVRLKTVDVLSKIGQKGDGTSILRMAEKNKDEDKAKTYAMILGKLNLKEANPIF